MTILLITVATASAAILLWQSDVPDTTRSLQLCERVRSLQFNQKKGRWFELDRPIKSVVVCPIPGTARDLKIEGLLQPYVDAPIADKMVSVDCYKSARVKSGAPALQMPDGMYCNIPDVVD